MKYKIITALLALMTVSACTPSVPKCGDTQIVDLVIKISGGEMVKQLGAEAATGFSYSVDSIRTRSTNEQTGAHECAAQLAITASSTNQTNAIPIEYTVELTDNGKDFYVNVFGL